jgi:HK97 family phage prohead protease
MQNETKQMDFQFNMKGLSEDGTFTGYASVFNVVDAQKDVIRRGAFRRTLLERGGEVKLLWQHKIDEPIGLFTKIFEDSHGLYVEGKLLLSVQRGEEAYALLKSGAINGMSIGYSVVDAEYDNTSGIRLISAVDLYEISLVTFPANEAATVNSVKSIPKTTREFERFLRDNGFSRSQAKSFALHGFVGKSDGVDDAIDDLIDELLS